jgi:hypothetical protein
LLLLLLLGIIRAASLLLLQLLPLLRRLLEAPEGGVNELVSQASVADASVLCLITIHDGMDTLKGVFAEEPDGAPARHESDYFKFDHVRLDLAVGDELAELPWDLLYQHIFKSASATHTPSGRARRESRALRP